MKYPSASQRDVNGVGKSNFNNRDEARAPNLNLVMFQISKARTVDDAERMVGQTLPTCWKTGMSARFPAERAI